MFQPQVEVNIQVSVTFAKLKAYRLHTCNDPHMPTDFRNTDKDLRLVMGVVRDERTDRRMDGHYQVYYLPASRSILIPGHVFAGTDPNVICNWCRRIWKLGNADCVSMFWRITLSDKQKWMCITFWIQSKSFSYPISWMLWMKINVHGFFPLHTDSEDCYHIIIQSATHYLPIGSDLHFTTWDIIPFMVPYDHVREF